jgi:flagellar basal body rod protein FlgG
MGSGKYGAVAGMITRMDMMENISEHLAAAKTFSYKKGVTSFEARLAEANSGMATKGVNYVKMTKETIDFTPGELEYSGNPLHVAINGDGFFLIQRDDGSIGYSRKGAFKMNPEGFLVDSGDRQVLSAEGDPIILTNPNVSISTDGTIWYQGQQLGQIAVVKFEDNSVLQRAEQSIFIPKDGTEPDPHPDPEVAQNNLETSNVDMMRTTVRMTSNLRAFEAMQKALTIYSKMGQKATEIGQLQ